MKKLAVLFFAATLVLSSAIISTSIPNDNSFSVSAQQTTVKRERKPGIARTAYRGGRWVVRRTWDGTKWVSHRVWVASKWTGKKTYKTSRKVVSRTKKIIY